MPVRDAVCELLDVPVRDCELDAVPVRDDVGVPVDVTDDDGVMVALAVIVGVEDGGAYCHDRPLVTGAPMRPLTMMYIVRVLSGEMTIVDAIAFDAHAPASGSSSESSLPRKH